MINKLNPEQVDRYSRHIIMPQVGSEGQRKLLNSSVLIIGAGGLGSPAALYLALAGAGRIGIAATFKGKFYIEMKTLERAKLRQPWKLLRHIILMLMLKCMMRQ